MTMLNAPASSSLSRPTHVRARSASIGGLVTGGSSRNLGRFQRIDDGTTVSLPRSVSVDGGSAAFYAGKMSTPFLTATEMGKQELYQQVPCKCFTFEVRLQVCVLTRRPCLSVWPVTAVFGLQRKEHSVLHAFADYASELEVSTADGALAGGGGLSEEERKSRISLMIMDELEFDAKVVTLPLIFAVVVAAMSQFLVGYNTGVMNAPEKVVFPGHSTLSWSLAVAAFAVGGPFGAISEY
jgi:hypothetical protein